MTNSAHLVVRDETGRELEIYLRVSNDLVVDMVHQGEQVGQLKALLWFEFGRQEWEILEFSIAKNYQRQGLGTILCKFMLDHATKTAINAVWADISVENTAAQAFAKKMNFSAPENEPDYWEYEIPARTT